MSSTRRETQRGGNHHADTLGLSLILLGVTFVAPNKRKTAQAAKAKQAPTRRTFMTNVPRIAAGAVILAALGFWGAATLRADLAEQDTSVVGQGTPTVVQVHSTTCAPCVALRRETLAALSDIDESTLKYRIANLDTDAGLAFASKYGASYTTLLLFDGDGNLSNRIQGETPRDSISAAFRTLIAADAQG